MFIVCEAYSSELKLSDIDPSLFGEFDPGFFNSLSLSTHFSLSTNNTLSNDYMYSNDVPITYNYGFEIGLFKNRIFTKIPNTRIWQYGIMFGTTNFRSSLEEEHKNTLFVNDKEKVPYSTIRRFTHNSGFVTLRATASIQFSFFPQELMIIPGIKGGYRFSEDYEDYLSSESQKIVEYLPSHATLRRNNNVTYIVDKQNQGQDYLYGLQFGIAYQLEYKKRELFSSSPHITLLLGMEYVRANLLGSGVQNYLFWGINFRFTR